MLSSFECPVFKPYMRLGRFDTSAVDIFAYFKFITKKRHKTIFNNAPLFKPLPKTFYLLAQKTHNSAVRDNLYYITALYRSDQRLSSNQDGGKNSHVFGTISQYGWVCGSRLCNLVDAPDIAPSDREF